MSPKSNYFIAYLLILLLTILLNAQIPDSITQEVTYNNETYTLKMYKESMRANNFEVLKQESTGEYTTVAVSEEIRTFVGEVEELPGAFVTGIWGSDEKLKTRITMERGLVWNTSGGSVTGTGGENNPTYAFPDPVEDYTSDKNTVFEWTQAFDMSYSFFEEESDFEKIVEAIEYQLSQIKPIYLRDAMVTPTIGRIIVRTSPDHCPYNSNNNVYDILGIVSDEWRNNQTDTDYFMAGGFVSYSGGAGIAYCPGAYTANGCSGTYFEKVARHEWGHNWSVRDYQSNSPEGKTINCGNSSSRFNGMSVGKILERRDANTDKLKDIGYYTTAKVPPYARLDIGTHSGGSSLTFDVLKNDHDCNGDKLTLESFDQESIKGASLSRSVGTGANGQDEIIYKSPTSVGLDRFFYTVSDASGKTAQGIVLIDVNTVGITMPNSSINHNAFSIIPTREHTVKINFFVEDNAQNLVMHLYNSSGKRINTIASGDYARGSHTVTFNCRDDNGKSIATGLYFIEFRNRTGKKSFSRKFLISN